MKVETGDRSVRLKMNESVKFAGGIDVDDSKVTLDVSIAFEAPRSKSKSHT
jgi:hypothetical protein